MDDNVIPLQGQSFAGTQDLKTRQHNISYIEPSEEAAAQDLIDAQFRELTKGTDFPEGVTLRKHCRLTRFFAAVKIYIRPDELKEVTDVHGEKKVIYLPEEARAEDRYSACVGVVCELGPQAFQDKDGNPRGCKYKIGDWLVFPRTDIIRINFLGIPLGVLTDDRAILVTDDPRFWTQGSLSYKA